MRSLLIVLAFISASQATISPAFRAFVAERYGSGMADMIARDELGGSGSTGGGDNGKTTHTPLIYVHDFMPTSIGGEKLLATFREEGYTDSELYTTTYGEKMPVDVVVDIIDKMESTAMSSRYIAAVRNTVSSVLGWFTRWFTGRGLTPFTEYKTFMRNNTEYLIYPDKMRCRYVRQIRTLIQAVSAYTNRKVKVIAYGTGGPLSRKAILGGHCVDEPEFDLGAPLTGIVSSYLSIAGAQQGMLVCVPYVSSVASEMCNRLNGLSCDSKFIKDINNPANPPHYEGEWTSVLQSNTDIVVGYYNLCKTKSAEIANANETYTMGLLHGAGTVTSHWAIFNDMHMAHYSMVTTPDKYGNEDYLN